MRTFIALIIGICVGYFINDQFSSKKEVVRSVSKPKKEVKLKAIFVDSDSVAQPIVAAPAPEISKIQRAKQKISVYLDESIVSEMEREWNDLPQQAETTIDNEGWRIQILRSNSLFSQAGFKSGDLIRREKLYAAFVDNQADLAIRIEKILNSISR